MSAWTEERVALASDLWLKGLTAGQIAEQLGGGLTRSAVMGKVARLGLTRSDEVVRLNRKVATARQLAGRGVTSPKPARIRAPREFRQRLPEAPLPPEQPHDGDVVPLEAADAHHCRWPIGTPGEATFGFCGRDKARGSYCAAHARIAYQPAPAKSRAA